MEIQNGDRLEDPLVEKQALNNENKTFKAQKKALEDELANINKMSEEEKKAKETRVTEINQAIVKIDNDIKVNIRDLFEIIPDNVTEENFLNNDENSSQE